MLVHRLRRWPSINPTMDECVVFAGRRVVSGGQRMMYGV